MPPEPLLVSYSRAVLGQLPVEARVACLKSFAAGYCAAMANAPENRPARNQYLARMRAVLDRMELMMAANGRG